MDTILLLTSNPRDSQLLAEYLQGKYHIISSESTNVLETAFDLCIVDGRCLNKQKDRIAARKVSEKGVFVPVLLATVKKDVDMLTSRIWQTIDDVISSPVRKAELYARVEVLLRARRLSLELKGWRENQVLQAEQALFKSEELQKAIISCSPLAIYSLDRTENVLSWNPAAEAMFGWMAQEIIGKPLPIAAPNQKTECIALMHRILAGESISGMELVRQRKDGSSLQCSLAAAPIRNPQGDIVGIMATMNDITERKRTEKALSESETRFRSLFQNNHATMLIVDPTNGAIVDVNPAACAYYGWPWETMIQMKVSDINTLSPEEIHEELNRAQANERNHFEFRHRLADDTVRDVEVYSGPICLLGRNLLYSLVFDITERKTAEQACLNSEARFRLLVENAPDGIFVQTRGRFAYLNRAAVRIFGGTEAAEFVGVTVVDCFSPEYREKVRERIHLLNHEKTAVPMLYEIALRKDGTTVDIETSAVPMHFDGHDGALVFVREISQRINAEKQHQLLEQQLHQAQKMESIGRLAGGVAHDYNNMLSVILGYAQLALEKVDPKSSLHDNLLQIHEAGQRSVAITRQLLAFARKQAIAPLVLNLNNTIESMVKMLKRLIGEDIDLRWLPAADLPPVKIDPSQVDQILANLCVNARDAIIGTGTITIETSRATLDTNYCAQHQGVAPGDYVLLAVSDDGHGIEPEVLGKIFEPFFTTKELGRGTGLGLATVYGIVQQNNGFVNAYSEPGLGTTFKIYLPQHAQLPTQMGEEPKAPIPKGRGETILVVEDEAIVLKLADKMLTDLGYSVLTANSSTEAIRLVHENSGKIDLLFSDVIMPEMNGRDLAQQLLTLQPGLKCLFMSGYTGTVIASHNILDQRVNFIQKPFTKRDLAAKVHAVLLS